MAQKCAHCRNILSGYIERNLEGHQKPPQEHLEGSLETDGLETRRRGMRPEKGNGRPQEKEVLSHWATINT